MSGLLGLALIIFATLRVRRQVAEIDQKVSRANIELQSTHTDTQLEAAPHISELNVTSQASSQSLSPEVQLIISHDSFCLPKVYDRFDDEEQIAKSDLKYLV